MSLRITPPELSYRESVLSPGKIVKREETISSPDGRTTEREEIRISFNRNVKVVQNYRTVEMDGAALSPSDWTNLYESVFREERGEQDYTEKLEQQITQFQKSCQEGSFVRNIAIHLTERRFREDAGIKATRIRPGLTSKTAVGAYGHAVVEKNELIPDNNFFVPGRTFEVRVVHSNFPNAQDDVEIGIRTLAIKFADHHAESPLDLVCYTGYLSPFFTPASVQDYLASLDSEEARKKYLFSLPIYLKTHIEGMRYKPDSYYHQHYYSQRIYDLFGSDGVRRLVRVRLIPADGSFEMGRLSPEQQREAWKTARDPEDETPADYLKREFLDRMSGGPVEYHLQLQVNDTDFGHMMYNASLPWEELVHPWVTVARITLTRQMPDDVMKITRFNMTNLPEDTIRVHAAESSLDFNVVPRIMNNACVNIDQFSPVEPDFIEGDTTDYIVHVVTGNKPGAGTDSNVFISIIGTEGSTSYRKLHNPWRNILEKAEKDTFVVVDRPVGDFLCAKIYKDNRGAGADWFCEYIVLAMPYNGRCYTLPCYQWFSGKKTVVSLKDGKGVLLTQEKNPYLRLQRKLEIQDRQQRYRWAAEKDRGALHGLPGFIAAGSDFSQLPRDLQFDDLKQLENAWLQHVSKLKAIWERIKKGLSSAFGFLRKGGAFAPFVALAAPYADKLPGLKHVLENWTKDTEFGRQLMNGPNPMKLMQITALPDNFDLNPELIEDQLSQGKTFDEELHSGRFYMVTYPELQNFSSYDDGRASPAEEAENGEQEEGAKSEKKKEATKERHICAPMCLLYSKNGTLIPLAIQLTQVPTVHTPIYTKEDDRGEFSDWMIAKMWVRVADANLHQLSVHILGTYLILEPIALALMRNLPAVHPVHKLLHPHLRYIPAINTVWRRVLLGEGMAFSQTLGLGEKIEDAISFMRNQYNTFKISSLHLPENLIARGVLSKDGLPGFHYRDDTIRLWGAVQSFAADVVAVHYRDDEEVELDDELTLFLQDLRNNGFHEDAEVPDRFRSREELIRFITIVVFRATAQHSAVNKGQVTVYTFTPNAPPALMQPPPTEKRPGGWEADAVRRLLPPPEIAEQYNEMCRLFVGFNKNASHLGEYPEKLFSDERSVGAVRAFRRRLDELSGEIKTRNAGLAAPYTALLPENVKTGIRT